MNKEHMAILTNIIGAVESGGQVYGRRRYDAYAGAYSNTPNEVTCTLGWAQNYGNEGRKLCQMILDADPVAFRRADTAGIEQMLGYDWVASKWNPNLGQQKALVAIISTATGQKCQDQLFEELMNKYIGKALAFDPNMGVPAQMMWCEIEHLGGIVPTTRIFLRASKPYTVDSVMASLKKDQNDTSNNNQVGDAKFQSRHDCCAKWIKQYVQEVKPVSKVTAKQVIGNMESWIGMNRANGTHKPILDIYNSHKPLARGYAVKPSDEYCDTTVSAAFIKAGDVSIIGGTECGVEEHIQLFKKAGIWIEDGTIVPAVGDIVCYNWDKKVQPNDGYADHIGIVSAVDKYAGKFDVIEGNMNGVVGVRRGVDVGWGCIRGFARPKYAVDDPAKNLCKSPRFTGKVDLLSLPVRTGAGTEYPLLPEWQKLAHGDLVDVCDRLKASNGKWWFYIRIAGRYYGFVRAKYILGTLPKGKELNNGQRKYVGRCLRTLPVRRWAGKMFEHIDAWPYLDTDNLVEVLDTIKDYNGNDWHYIRIAGKHLGFVKAMYITRT